MSISVGKINAKNSAAIVANNGSIVTGSINAGNNIHIKATNGSVSTGDINAGNEVNLVSIDPDTPPHILDFLKRR